MIIVSDTSPISNLAVIGQLPLLRALYSQLIIPNIVYQELTALETFGIDISLIQTSEWIVIRSALDRPLVQILQAELDDGEAEAIALAIALAIELQADRLLIDERLGRRVAERYGLKITGLLGILMAAKQENLIPAVKTVLDQLINQARFRVHPNLYRQILQDVGEAEN